MTTRTVIRAAPHLAAAMSTPRIMTEVCLALVPVILVATYYFGVSALVLVATTTIGALAAEWLMTEKALRRARLTDGSALLTGLLLGLVLPPAIPLWMALLGSVIAIGFGKVVWGGLGANIFNPALLGRAFLQAAFPQAMTSWVMPHQDFWSMGGNRLAMPLMAGPMDVVSGATPLGLAKFESVFTPLVELLRGDVGGSLGETSAGLLLLCGLWLAWRRIFDWRLPVATLVTVLVLSALFHLVVPDRCGSPLFMLTSGGLLFGAVFMVTDPVTTPVTAAGMWIFGAGVGLLVVMIRVFGGLPEGVMYGILLMNAVTPLINRATQPKVFGGMA